MNSKIRLGIIASLLLLLFVFGFAVYSQNQATKHFVLKKPVNLSSEQLQIYTDRLADAQKRLSEAKDQNDLYELYIYQGYQYQGLGELAVAKKSYLKAIDIFPEKYQAYAALFQTELEIQDFEGARKTIQIAIENYQNSPDLWNKYILLEQEKFSATNEQIIALYEEALVKTSANADVLVTYAPFLESIGQIDRAIQMWRKALEKNPSNGSVYEEEIARLNLLLN